MCRWESKQGWFLLADAIGDIPLLLSREKEMVKSNTICIFST